MRRLLLITAATCGIFLSPLAVAQEAPSKETLDSAPEYAPTSPKAPWKEPSQASAQEESSWVHPVLLWIPNRVLDLIDVFRVDVGVGPAVGGVVRVSKYAQAGYRQMIPGSLRVGDFGRDIPVMFETSTEIGVSPLFKQSKDRSVCSLEVGAGADLFIAGGYGGVCFDELADFLGGLVFIDFKEDDL